MHHIPSYTLHYTSAETRISQPEKPMNKLKQAICVASRLIDKQCCGVIFFKKESAILKIILIDFIISIVLLSKVESHNKLMDTWLN